MASSILFPVGQDVDGRLGCCIAGFWCEHTGPAPHGYDSHCLRARNEPRLPQFAVIVQDHGIAPLARSVRAHIVAFAAAILKRCLPVLYYA